MVLIFILLSIGILLKKKGSFPSGHVSDNKALRKQGIKCAKTQDKEEQNRETINR